MPSGPKKRKAAKRKKEALGIHVNGSIVSSISSSGSNSLSSTKMASLDAHGEREVETKEVEEHLGSLGNGKGVEEQPNLTHEAKEVVGVEPQSQGTETREESSNENVESDKGDDQTDDLEVSNSEELKKSMYAGEASCIVERSVSLTKEVKSSEVPIEKVRESVSVDVKAAEEQVGKIEPSSLLDPAASSGKQEEKFASSSGDPIEELRSDCAQEKMQNSSYESGSMVVVPLQVAHKTSWLSCCGLFDAFLGSNR